MNASCMSECETNLFSYADVYHIHVIPQHVFSVALIAYIATFEAVKRNLARP